MNSDFYIKLDGVEGETLADQHKGEVEVLSWSWDVSQHANLHGGGSGSGRAQPGLFNFTHRYDKASPVMAKYCASGVHFKSAKFTARKAGGGQEDYLVITMKELMISHIAPTGSQGGEVHESVSATYKDIEFSYKPQGDDGKLKGEVKFGWDTQKHTYR